MARGRPRRGIVPKNVSGDDSYSLRNRRSSMRVNLSYMSNLSDSGHVSFKRTNIASDETVSEETINQNDNLVNTVKKPKTKASNINNDTTTPASISNITVINADTRHLCANEETETDDDALEVIKEKEQQLNRSCLQLKDAIMSKTQALFDRETELAIKTSEVLATAFNSPSRNINEINDQTPPRSPSIRINIGKNDQIIMSGDGNKRNPVKVNSMLKDCAPQKQCDVSGEEDDENDMDCSQSIASTPKKSRLECSTDGKGPKADETILKIPVARLFADDNDPNNSMSKVNQGYAANNLKNIVENENETDGNNFPNTSNGKNYTISPILSQGTRRSRLRLSLKKKLAKTLTQDSSRLSSNTTIESFINKLPLTCSSFAEKLEEIKNKNSVNNDKTVDLSKKNEASNNCRTIDLDDNANNSKTINVETSNETSCMEITTIPTIMPIVRRSLEFQDIIRKSLNLESVCNEYKNSQKFDVSTQNKVSLNAENHGNSSKEISETTKRTQNSNAYQEDCSTDTERTSLNVNTSTDQISLADYVQKENKRPNNIEEVVNKRNTNQTNENESTINSCQNNHTIHLSKKNSALNSSNNKEKENNGAISFQSTNDHQEKEIPKSKVVEKNSNIVISGELSCDINREKENDKIMSRQPSTSTVRSSMQVNTSLDSARKSPIAKNVLDFNKILSMVEENTCNGNQTKTSVYSSNDQSSNSESELENVSLMERIRNISAAKKNGNTNQGPNPAMMSRKRKSTESENENIKSSNRKLSKSKSIKSNTSRKVEENENIEIADPQKLPETKNNKSTTRRKSTESRKSSLSARKSSGIQNTSSTAETSVIEATPYPASRSVLFKTMIKNNIDMNTLDPRRFVDLSDDDDEESSEEYQTVVQKKTGSPVKKYQSVYARKKTPSPNLMDTVILNSSDESSNESDKEKDPVIIDESLNETKKHNKSKNPQSDEEQTNKKGVPKRKLYPLRDNSQLISFSPADIQESPKVAEAKTVVKKRKRKETQKKKQENNIVTQKSPELDHEIEPLENEILPKTEKKKKKPRKIISKKIVVKKVMNLSILDKMMDDDEALSSQRLSERNSLREFDLRRLKCRRKENVNKKPKIIIVVTGLPKEDRDLIKSVIKSLGSATLEVNVTPRTTHVISSGIRTINLLKGILRGCWLLSLEWALKSLENEKWLDPSPYEMSHFSKAVQENRRDRQLFGKAYVPELFVTCGFIYVENGTIPPSSTLKELIKIAGGRITEDPSRAEISIGSDGLKEIWVLDSITTGEIQNTDQYKRT